MSDFKAVKKGVIAKSEKQGDRLNDRGNDLANKAEIVDSMIQSLKVRDDFDKNQIERLKYDLKRDFEATHEKEVDSPLDSLKVDMKKNQAEIEDERKNTTGAISEIRKMQGVSDVGKDAERRAEKSMTESEKEYKGMEDRTEDIISSQEAAARESARRIHSKFK